MNLTKKYEIERKFHDLWAKSIKESEILFKETFESITAIENKYALSQFGKIAGKKILDLGCGMGDATLYFASKRALVAALDISPGMIGLVTKMAKKHRLSGFITPKVGVAEKLPYRANTFDFVFGNGVLHHAEPSLALKEVHRVLKKGGVAAFVEPLAHNPVINIYRKMANEVRTTTEKPIKFSQLKKLTTAKFKSSHHQEFHLSTLLIFVYFYLINRISPNKERYWKKIINEGQMLEPYFSILNKLDTKLIGKIPLLGKYCWNTVLVYRK